MQFKTIKQDHHVHIHGHKYVHACMHITHNNEDMI